MITTRTADPKLRVFTASPTPWSYRLLRSKRRTMAIDVYPDGQVVVRVPQRVARREIESFLSERDAWVRGHLARAAAERSSLPQRNYREGETFLVLGQEHRLRVGRKAVGVGRPCCRSTGGYLYVDFPPNAPCDVGALRGAIRAWYRQLAARVIAERVATWAPVIGQAPSVVRVRAPKHRWGSCNPRLRSMNFNYVVAMAPIRVIDYVVVHELCHLEIADHSPRYWKRVADVLPDFSARRSELETLAAHLVL